MDIEQRTAALTTAYIHSYNLALKEVKNPNLAAQIATAVIMVPKMLGNERLVYGIVRPSIEQHLRENVEKQVRKVLEA